MCDVYEEFNFRVLILNEKNARKENMKTLNTIESDSIGFITNTKTNQKVS